jgi:signal transduction histidine kinase
MNRGWDILRRFGLPALLVAVAALLAVPWTNWVVQAAYERDVNEKSAMLVNRVKIQLQNSWSLNLGPSTWMLNSPQQILDLLRGELMGDPTVQAVVFWDYKRNNGGYVVRNSTSVPVPRSAEDIKRLINSPDPNSVRRAFPWGPEDNPRGVIYLDLSRPELEKHFASAYRPLRRNVTVLTSSGIIIIGAVGILAYHIWFSAHRQRQRAELEQQGMLAERGLTAAVLAHEIRNPLAALRFQLHSLRRNGADEGRVTRVADTIDSELLRIQQLVQDYLVHEKAQAMRVLPVELTEAVRDLQTLMSELLREGGTRLVLEADTTTKATVACDPHALRQILMNLVINAQQAMGRGGAITVRIGQRDGMGTISVSDTGPGIPAEMRDNLFKPFATSKKGGSGIGLALVKRFVDNFGGSVAVESEEGKGTTFHLSLPLIESARPRSAADAPPPPLPPAPAALPPPAAITEFVNTSN